MKRLLYGLASIFLFSTILAVEAKAASNGLVLGSIEVVAGNDKPEQVVFKLNGSYTPKSFRLNGDNPRLVFDFYGVKYPSEIIRIDDIDGNIIAGIRVGRHNEPPKTRVVVDIQKDSPYLHEETFNVSNNSLVVTFTPDFPKVASEDSIDQPPRIVVDNTKVVHSGSQTKPEGEVPATDEKEFTQGKDTPVEIAATPTQEDTPVEIAATPTQEVQETATSSPAAEPETPTEPSPPEPPAPPAPSPPVQPSEPSKTEQQTQLAKPEQPVEPQSIEAEDIVPVLLDVSFEKSINDSETVLFRLNHFYPPLVFGIEKGEPRVVCDFFDAEIDEKISPVIEAGGQFVDRIIVTNESDPDKVRVELVLMPNRNYDLQQLFFKEDNLFVVIVKELKEDSAAAN
ncbi:MAG: AMIN domain-containing protein [Desulfofustis sp.]|nr:AMIN domain-containing protein [Desulfofustis sp.]